MSWSKHRRAVTLVFPIFCLSVIATSGCDRKEKVIDIKTPAGSIEVERSKDTGKVEVDVDANRQAP